MINQIKIKQHPFIRESNLYNLSSINVICGPNNSGKTTLLNAILNSKYAITGEIFDDNAIEEIYNTSVIATSWEGKNDKLNKQYKDLLIKVINSKDDKIWFSHEINHFTRSIINEYGITINKSPNRLPYKQFFVTYLQNIFKNLTEQSINAIILPPKRNFQTSGIIQTEETINPSGIGLLNNLFYAKNQSNISSERKMYDRIVEAFNNISEGYNFEISINQPNTLTLKFSPKNDFWLDATQCGLGLQDLLVIIYYAEVPDKNLICVEEPESHLHPHMQRRLLIYLKEKSDRQFILTTHSNVFLNNSLIDRVFVTSYKKDFITVTDATSRASALNDLGYSVADNLLSDVVILVEGPKDIPVIEEFLLKMNLLKKYNIKIWPLGGDIMDQVDLDVFIQNYSILALIDKDPGSANIRKKFESKCIEKNIPVYQLKRYSLENYFSLTALRAVFGKQIPSSIQIINSDEKLEDQISINVKKNNKKISQLMTLDEIEGTDLWDFLQKVKSTCEAHSTT